MSCSWGTWSERSIGGGQIDGDRVDVVRITAIASKTAATQPMRARAWTKQVPLAPTKRRAKRLK